MVGGVECCYSYLSLLQSIFGTTLILSNTWFALRLPIPGGIPTITHLGRAIPGRMGIIARPNTLQPKQVRII
jgi:hypothetical protein